jgi:hypothetical protein
VIQCQRLLAQSFVDVRVLKKEALKIQRLMLSGVAGLFILSGVWLDYILIWFCDAHVWSG